MDAVVLDANVLSLLAHPSMQGEPAACRLWISDLKKAGWVTVVPEIADYELRRELIRIRSRSSISRLNSLRQRGVFLPITSRGMLRAAALWAKMRSQGTPTAHPERLDVDVILAAHVQLYAARHGYSVVVATANVRHLSLMVDAREWPDILP
jgi:hypothetical protein